MPRSTSSELRRTSPRASGEPHPLFSPTIDCTGKLIPNIVLCSYLCIAGHFDNSQIADVARKAFPDQASRIPDAEVTSGKEHFKTDSSLVEKELGIKWISFEDSVKDTLGQIFQIEKELKGSS